MDASVTVRSTPIPGVFTAHTEARADHRGVFARLFCTRTFREIVGGRTIAQVNFSLTERAGAVRGMHYQRNPYAELKLIRCLRGRVWDVAVDLRTGSPTFLQWHSVELSAESGLTVVIPEGCAHGFQALEDGSELIYFHSEFYNPAAEGGIRPTDPALGIRWPLAISELSERDRNHPLLDADFQGLLS